MGLNIEERRTCARFLPPDRVRAVGVPLQAVCASGMLVAARKPRCFTLRNSPEITFRIDAARGSGVPPVKGCRVMKVSFATELDRASASALTAQRRIETLFLTR